MAHVHRARCAALIAEAWRARPESSDDDRISGAEFSVLRVARGRRREHSFFREVVRSARDLGDAQLAAAAGAGIGTCLALHGEHAAALPALRDAHAVLLRVLGAEHALTVATTRQLQLVLLEVGDGDMDMSPEMETTLNEQRRTLGPDHPETLASAVFFACSRAAVDDAVNAERILRDVLGAYRRKLGDDHEDTLRVVRILVDLRARAARASGPRAGVERSRGRRTPPPHESAPFTRALYYKKCHSHRFGPLGSSGAALGALCAPPPFFRAPSAPGTPPRPRPRRSRRATS